VHVDSTARPKEEQIGQDFVQRLLRSQSSSWSFVDKAGDKKLQELAVSIAAIEDLVDKFQFHLSKQWILQHRCFLEEGIHSACFWVEGLQEIGTRFPDTRGLGNSKNSILTRKEDVRGKWEIVGIHPDSRGTQMMAG